MTFSSFVISTYDIFQFCSYWNGKAIADQLSMFVDILLLIANSEGVDLVTSRLGHICYELAIYSNDDEALEHLSELAKKEPVLSEQSDHLLSDFEVVY